LTPNPLVTSLNTNTTLIAERMPGRGEPMLQGGVTVINSMTIGRGNEGISSLRRVGKVVCEMTRNWRRTTLPHCKDERPDPPPFRGDK
jgi:hypothetical protein